MLDKNKRFALPLLFVFALVLVFLPVQEALAYEPPIADVPTGVYGRTLSASRAGDTSDWVEIARNGGYSLIVRKDCLMDLGRVWFANIETDSYQISHVRGLVNNWFKNTLSSTARLRNFSVKNNALQDLGNFTAMTYGLSKPTATAASTGDDVAFLLSFAEAASFCSLQYANPGGTSFTTSSALARNNYYLLNKPGQGIMQDFWWLRSPGHFTNQVRTACSVGTHGGIISEGSVYTSSARADYPYVRPALWVGSGIFDDTTPNTFNLSYDANGGSGAPPAQTGITPNAYVAISTIIPTRTNYTFAGWALSATATAPQYQQGGSIFMGGNITLYAVWKGPQSTGGPEGVDGRILTPAKSGDNVNWVEIARYGKYSLIVRSSYINIYAGSGRYGDPSWQFTPSYGDTNVYISSNVRKSINAWFNGTGPTTGDNLPVNARMREYTMQNNAASTPGTASTVAGLTNGFSLPSNTYLSTGNDVSFALSYSEAANFCSITHQVRGLNPEAQESNAIAKLNYAKITIPPQYLYAAWLRSAGDLAHTAGALSTVINAERGRAFQCIIYANASAEKGLVYPALWVDSAVFDDGTFILAYDANGGSGAPAPQGVPANTNATISPTTPTRAGFSFLGWALTASATSPQYQPNGVIFMDGNKTLYAVWSPQVTDGLEGVDGRILPPAKSGDNVNWVEIARYGKYSLIVRSSYINIYAGSGRYGDASWQFTPSYGATSAYVSSGVRKSINAWFNGAAPTTGDNLPANARMREYTMQNNAASTPGTASTVAGLTNGFSLPSNTYLPTGDDVSFALSFSEAANFCSFAHFVRGQIPETQQSNAIAKLNFAKITIPGVTPSYTYGAWLRSPGDYTGPAGTTAGSLGYTGIAFQFYLSYLTANQSGLVYPALWVDSAVFDDDPVYTRTVIGYVAPMAGENADNFLLKHDIVVELRATFRTPASAELSTLAVRQADGMGKFILENVPFGEYVLYIKRPGFLARSMMVTISASDPLVVELSPPNGPVFDIWFGDCNDDGRIDNEDLLMIIELWVLGVDSTSPLYNPACDLNADGVIDERDVDLMMQMWGKIILDYPGAENVNVFI